MGLCFKNRIFSLMKNTSGLVSIITVNYNGYQDTCELIESLAKHECYPYEVIVVDNASRNDEAIKLQSRYPNICVVPSSVNLGFAGGNNLGYSIAQGEYIFFLNNDVVISGPILQPLVDRLNCEQVGLVSPKIKYEEDRSRIQFAGFTPLSSITLRNCIKGTHEIDEGQYNKAMLTPYVHGAAMMGKKALIEHVGLMTDVYFLFYEELDWSERFRKAGYELWYEPSAVVFHKECMTAKKGSPLRLYYMTRARLLFARRNMNGIYKFLSCFYLLTIPLSKNTFFHLSRWEWKHLFSLWQGTCRGLMDKSE